MRLPFPLLSAHRPAEDESDPDGADRLKSWLVQTLGHLERRSFIRAHLEDEGSVATTGGFVGELAGAGVFIGLCKLATKGQLDRIRNAFPSTINRITPTNSPVRLVAWVLDVPAQKIWDAAESLGSVLGQDYDILHRPEQQNQPAKWHGAAVHQCR